MKRFLFILFAFIAFLGAACGQCPGSDSLWHRFLYLRDAYKLPSSEKLKELVSYESTIKNCFSQNDSIRAFYGQRLGMAYFARSDFLKAITYLKQSINIDNSGRSSARIQDNIQGYFYLSAAYDSLNNGIERIKAADSCIQLAARLNSSSDISSIRSLYAKVEYLFDAGDYHSCIESAKMCEKFAWKYAAAHKNDQWEYMTGVIHASSSTAWNIEALLRLGDFSTAEMLLADKLVEYKKANLKNYFGITYDQLAHVQAYKGDFVKAFTFWRDQLRYDKELGYFFNCKQALNTIGYNIYFKHFNDNDRALMSYQEALRYGNNDPSYEAESSMESLNILNRIANVYVKKGLFDSAFYYYRKAFDQMKPGIDETDIQKLPSTKIKDIKKVYYLSALLIDKGDAYGELFNKTSKPAALTEAIRIYKIADAFLDTIKSGLVDLQSKLFWRSDSRRLYENAIHACYLQNNPVEAFYFFEKSRAVLLSDQLNEQRWMGEKDIRKQTQLEKRVLQLERELNSSVKSSDQYSVLENELFTGKQELERLKSLIRSASPLYYQNFVDQNFITTREVQDGILKEHQALIELFAGDSSVYILAITAQDAYLRKINKAAFDELSSTLTRYISDPDLLNKNFQEYVNVAKKLYDLLFQDINLPAGRVIISPEGKYIPFEALVTEVQPLTYFLEDHAVSYTYSARYLLMNFTLPVSQPSQTFAGFAPVQFSGLPSLTGSEQSLARMQNYFGRDNNFVGPRASKNNFLKEYSRYKIIQLYTHATDSGFTGEPVIYFADSALFLSDLFYETQPATSLIVLSACETAGGRSYNGEGVFSFNRQFAALGIPSSISSLWQVDDESSYKVTELFYKFLCDGLPIDVAMQKAKKEFIRTATTGEKRMAYYWAAPIVTGQTTSILLKKRDTWKWMAAISFFTVLAFWGWKYWRRNQKN